MSGEYDLWRNMSVRLAAGWSGFRGFTFVSSDWVDPNSTLGATPSMSPGLSYRPPQAARPSAGP